MIDRCVQHKKPALLARVDVVPYIDVMLVLLAIFLLTAPFLAPGHVPLPTLSRARALPPTIIRLTLHDAGHVTYQEEEKKQHRYTVQQLIPILQQRLAPQEPGLRSPVQVLLLADPKLSYGLVMHFLDRLQRAAIPDVSLMVRAEHLS